MEFHLNEAQQIAQDAARRMVARDIQPILDAHDPEKPLPKPAMLKIFALFGEQGLTAPRIPEADGGSGMSMLDYGLIFEQMPPWLAIAMMGNEVTYARIHAEATPEQRERFLPDLRLGRKISGTATSEPGAGSDPRGLTTRVRIEGDIAILNGRKIWISNGSVADVLAVTCIDGVDAKGRNTLKRIVVEPEKTPFFVRDIDTMGLNQGHLSEAVFEDLEVPAANLLTSGGDAAKMLTVTWNGNRPLLGLCAARQAERAFEMAAEYAGVRQQFGKPIAGHQLVQERLADMQTAVLTSRLLCYYALDKMDRGERANGTAAMAKRYAIRTCADAISLAIQVHGGMGITREMGLERMWRDVRMMAVPDGTDDILTLIQGREITGTGAFR